MESKLLKAVRTDSQTYNGNSYISQRKSAQKMLPKVFGGNI